MFRDVMHKRQSRDSPAFQCFCYVGFVLSLDRLSYSFSQVGK